jgi:2-hydroxy-3-keto-5-methylthiopentenyl-1-phosphate phosphatase
VKLVRRKKRAQLADVVELLTGFGRMFQNIDAKLEEIVELLRQEGDDD